MCLASNEGRPIRRTCPASESGAGVGPVFPDEFGFAGERAGAVFRNRVGDAFQPLACGKVLPAMLEVPALGEFPLDGLHGGNPMGATVCIIPFQDRKRTRLTSST